jgi:hypothetical protein
MQEVTNYLLSYQTGGSLFHAIKKIALRELAFI